MAQKGEGYSAQAIVTKETAHKHMPKEVYLLKLQDKLDQHALSVAKEALSETNDRFVESLVYHGDPEISPEVITLLLSLR